MRMCMRSPPCAVAFYQPAFSLCRSRKAYRLLDLTRRATAPASLESCPSTDCSYIASQTILSAPSQAAHSRSIASWTQHRPSDKCSVEAAGPPAVRVKPPPQYWRVEASTTCAMEGSCTGTPGPCVDDRVTCTSPPALVLAYGGCLTLRGHPSCLRGRQRHLHTTSGTRKGGTSTGSAEASTSIGTVTLINPAPGLRLKPSHAPAQAVP